MHKGSGLARNAFENFFRGRACGRLGGEQFGDVGDKKDESRDLVARIFHRRPIDGKHAPAAIGPFNGVAHIEDGLAGAHDDAERLLGIRERPPVERGVTPGQGVVRPPRNILRAHAKDVLRAVVGEEDVSLRIQHADGTDTGAHDFGEKVALGRGRNSLGDVAPDDEQARRAAVRTSPHALGGGKHGGSFLRIELLVHVFALALGQHPVVARRQRLGHGSGPEVCIGPTHHLGAGSAAETRSRLVGEQVTAGEILDIECIGGALKNGLQQSDLFLEFATQPDAMLDFPAQLDLGHDDLGKLGDEGNITLVPGPRLRIGHAQRSQNMAIAGPQRSSQIRAQSQLSHRRVTGVPRIVRPVVDEQGTIVRDHILTETLFDRGFANLQTHRTFEELPVMHHDRHQGDRRVQQTGSQCGHPVKRLGRSRIEEIGRNEDVRACGIVEGSRRRHRTG